MEKLNDDQRDELVAAINALVLSDVEYNESHQDAGDGYAHLPRESWSNIDDADLKRQLVEFGIDTMGLDSDELAELALDSLTMRAGTIYVPRGMLQIAAYPVGEVESQIDFSALDCPSIGIVTADHIEQIKRDVDSYVGSVSDDSMLVYTGSDVVWYCVLDVETFQAAIADAAERESAA